MKMKTKMLLAGEVVITSERGNSMLPIIKSGQRHELTPIKWQDAEVGDIVFCRVRGKNLTHLVKAKNNERGCLIGNNHGKVNGWTKQIFGKVTKIFPEPPKTNQS